MTDHKTGFILIGKIVGVHGVKGTVKVLSYAESPAVFHSGDTILLTPPGGREATCQITWVKPHNRLILMSLKGINSRDQAEPLREAGLYIEEARLPELEQGTYYWSDIIGLSVFTENETYIGCIESIIPTGSNDVYVVKDKDNEKLIPALESVVLEIDLQRGIMRVELPEGL